MESNDMIWKMKLAAWLHDPAEKSLVLFRDPTGHEQGTVRAMFDELFPGGLPKEIAREVRRADRWAAAADRPQFPRRETDGPYAEWAQVRFDREPVLIHPLSGEEIVIKEGFCEIEPEHLKAVSTHHFRSLICRNEDDTVDFRKTALTLWRFGPEKPAGGLGALWGLLPADTRTPDHTIWSHVDLTAAFASASYADTNRTPALLAVSFGPVQDFIAQSRSTSDLWAGSHLLSRIAWEGIKVVCTRLGPDSVIFPQLRGVPSVDYWLLHECRLDESLFNDLAWRKQNSDANPLFVAALPNRFVAIVPESMAEDLAKEVTARVRAWASETALNALESVLDNAGLKNDGSLYCRRQVRDQMEDFPEVNWASVPWSLVSENGGRLDTSNLENAARAFYTPSEEKPGFLGSSGWKIFQSEISLDGAMFYRPNPGVLYPAVYDLLDRLAAAGKSLRPFKQLGQQGYRCSLCGEREWLAMDVRDLDIPPGERQDTIWAKLTDRRKAWNRKGEHLCAPCTLKRLWPSIFMSKEVREVMPGVSRYVVSTHTMALSTSIERWLQSTERKAIPALLLGQMTDVKTSAALPRKLDRMLHDEDEQTRRFIKGLPVLLDEMRNGLIAQLPDERQQADDCLRKINEEVKGLFGRKPEAYYSLMMMDGDRMGAWVSGTDPGLTLPYEESWHRRIRDSVSRFSGNRSLEEYLKTPRSASPARHMAISSALNAFALQMAPFVVEEIYKGKLLYAGGDDVLAMMCVDDVLHAMLVLRLLYSGTFPDSEREAALRSLLNLPSEDVLKIRKGHVWTKTTGQSRLYRMMGRKATASVGVVVAHHMAPLGRVLRILRETEKRAKGHGGRDAFSITLLKRSGGAVEFTCPWFIGENLLDGFGAMEVIIELRDVLADADGLSRRSAYLIQDWVHGLPLPEQFGGAEDARDEYRLLLEKTLAHQFERQAGKNMKDKVRTLAGKIASLAMAAKKRGNADDPRVFIRDLVAVAEFVAREGRTDQTA